MTGDGGVVEERLAGADGLGEGLCERQMVARSPACPARAVLPSLAGQHGIWLGCGRDTDARQLTQLMASLGRAGLRASAGPKLGALARS